jgi:hypothetical protein
MWPYSWPSLRGQRNPSGQRAFSKAASHCSSVPYYRRNSRKDRSRWNWIALRAMPCWYLCTGPRRRFAEHGASWVIKTEKAAPPQTRGCDKPSAQLSAEKFRSHQCPDRFWRSAFQPVVPLVAQTTCDQRAAPLAKHPAEFQEPQHARRHRQPSSMTGSAYGSRQGKSCC